MKEWLKRNIFPAKPLYYIASGFEEARWSYRYQTYRKKYIIHPTFKFVGEGISLGGDGKIILGRNSYIGRYSIIETHPESTVKVGVNCMLGAFVSMQAVSWDKARTKAVYGDIILGDHVWVGWGVFIKHGVEIGDNSIIGANSVVTRNIPANVVAAGCPARLRSPNISYEGQHIFLK